MARMTRMMLCAVGVALLTSGVARAQDVMVDPDRVDRFTFAVPALARVTHVSLDLRIDFAERRAIGTARLRVLLARGATDVVLDTKDLEIDAVTNPNNQPLAFALGDPDPIRGRPLTIVFPEPAKSAATVAITIAYRTSPQAAALQWLSPQQTAGGKLPYLFSQGQAILTRTWIPTQDSPGLRQTYDARIVVPDGMRAVMSAESLTPDGEPVEVAAGAGVASPGKAFRFRMPQSIPPYLIALAVGDIAHKPIGTRAGVYTEPSRLDAAAAEFADLERMISTAESLVGTYRWRRYDVLVLPPAFPYGGMENPRLTFVSPTIIAGDRSLVSVVVHELAHSWSGNLVTNATWRDGWLNEGLTTYLELRLTEALYGAERARMLETLGRAELVDEIARLGARAAQTQLHLPDAGEDPDATLGVVMYEKGAAFFRMLETSLGRERLDPYLKGYFERFAFKTITTPMFVADLREYLLGNDPALETRLNINEWLEAPGLPGNATTPRSEAFATVEATAAAFVLEGTVDELDPATWSTQEWQRFLTKLPVPLSHEKLGVLDARFQLSKKTNSEVLFAWLKLAAGSQYGPAVPALEAFLGSMGRRKFVEPLFATLMASEWGKPIARQLYPRVRPSYHAVVAAGIDRIVVP